MVRLDIGNLMSEARNDRTKDMDRMSVQELLAVMNEEDGKVAEAVGRELPAIEQAIGLAVKALRAGGHIFYLGAGTSGRIGVMDAVPMNFRRFWQEAREPLSRPGREWRMTRRRLSPT